MRRLYYRLDCSGLAALLESLKQRGYALIGPRVHGDALQWRPIDSLADLPAATGVELGPGHYRLTPGADGAYFSHAGGMNSLKALLHPPQQTLTTIQKNGNGWTVQQEVVEPRKRAVIGVRACDLASLAALDRVLLGDGPVDEIYRAHRADLFLIAVQCTQSGATCFCSSMGAGPRAKAGFDLALTERTGEGAHEFLVEAGSPAGKEVLEALGAPAAPSEWAGQSAEATQRAAAEQTRAVHLNRARAVIDQTFDHPRWEQTAKRCLACGNCTSSCPTCFCVNYEDRSSLDLDTAQRVRVWDSCFTQSFTYIHGGSIRLSPKSRYRQWLSHKLARWQDQFGVPGCSGCGRCITWCPAGIDITEEFAALEQASDALATAGGGSNGH